MSVTVASRIRSRLTERRIFAGAQSVAKPRVLYCKRNKSTKRELAHCDASGFYPTEFVNGRFYNWTDGHAVLKCSLPRQVALKWLWIDLATGPDANSFELLFNGKSLVKRTRKGRFRLRLRLPDNPSSNQFTIQIDSGVFIPTHAINHSNDGRTLGILVGEIRVAKFWWRTNGAEPIVGLGARFRKLFTATAASKAS